MAANGDLIHNSLKTILFLTYKVCNMTFSNYRKSLTSLILALAVVSCADSDSSATDDSKVIESTAATTQQTKDAVPMVVTSVDVDPADQAAVITHLTQSLSQYFPGGGLQSVKASPIAGLYEVTVKGGPTLFSNAQGDYFVAGDIYNVTPGGGIVNLGERNRETSRADTLAAIASEDMIVFAPEGSAKAYVTVFTDIDCGYCRKLHDEVPALNDLGIEVRYLAYPRAGLSSASFNKIATAWCADDPNEALTALKNGQTLPTNVCDSNPIAEQYTLGGQIGVRGTPAIVTESGKMLPGYMPANALAAELGVL